MRLTLDLTGSLTPSDNLQAADATEPDLERFTGPAILWGARGATSLGMVTIPAGSIDHSAPRVPVITEHDRARPVGAVESLTDTGLGLVPVVRFGLTAAGRTARQEVLDGSRTGVSVDLVDVVLSDDRSTLISGRLIALGHATIPAYADSHLALAAADTPQEEPMPDELTAAAPLAPPAAAMPPATVRPASFTHELATRLMAARQDGGDGSVMSTLTAALADITPGGNGAGNGLAGLATQAVGELCTSVGYDDKYAGMVMPRELTGASVTGWRWGVKPVVGPYAGNKTAIPTNAATMEAVTSAAQRIAGGHDLDRIYLDLGNPSDLTAYWRAMTYSYLVNLDAARLSAITGAAGTLAAADSLTDALLKGSIAVPSADYALVASDLYQSNGATPADTLPALLTGEGIFGNMLPKSVEHAAELAPGTVIVGNRSAVDFFTRNPPIKLEAVNIPLAGIDAGLYGYWAALETSCGAVAGYTAGGVAAADPARRK